MPDGHMLVTFGAVDAAAADTETVANRISQQLEVSGPTWHPFWPPGAARRRATTRGCKRGGTRAPPD